MGMKRHQISVSVLPSLVCVLRSEQSHIVILAKVHRYFDRIRFGRRVACLVGQFSEPDTKMRTTK
jgi:hypothetical protein